jgi:putative SOS response-associated peptidase YedK
MARFSDGAAICRRFAVRGRWPEFPATRTMRAGDITPVLRPGPGGKREIAHLRWGLDVDHPLAKDAAGSLTAVSSLSIVRAAMLQDLFPTQRCIVPVDAFYAGPVAWAKGAPEWGFALHGEELMGIAALWFADRAGGMDRFAIITTGPNESVALIEEAMPAILLPRDEAAWLSTRTDPYRAHRLIMPYPAEAMRAWPVASHETEAPDLLHRVA